MRAHAAISTEGDTVLAVKNVCAEVAAGLAGEAADMALLFFSPHHRESVHEMVSLVQKSVTPRVLLGCTGEGIIGDDQEVERRPALSLWAGRLPGATLTPFSLRAQETAEGVSFQGWPTQMPDPKERPVFLLLADPFSTPGRELLAFLQEKYPGVPAVGGMASGAGDADPNRLILNGRVLNEGVVGVAMTGSIEVRTVVSQGCRPIGERLIVTKADRNIIYELGGRPALDCLQEVFTSLSPEDQRLAQMALHVGCAITEYQERYERGDFLVRNMMGADKESGAIAITDLVQEGQTVQFHVRDAKTASEDLHLLLGIHKDPSRSHAVRGALLFSCNGRGQRLFGTPHHDITAIRTEIGNIPIAGFFAQGEIGPIGGKNFLHGFTASVALFCQPGEPPHPPLSPTHSLPP